MCFSCDTTPCLNLIPDFEDLVLVIRPMLDLIVLILQLLHHWTSSYVRIYDWSHMQIGILQLPVLTCGWVAADFIVKDVILNPWCPWRQGRL